MVVVAASASVASLSIAVAVIGDGGDVHRLPSVRNTTVSEGLPPERVRQLIGAGWEVAAHSLTHPDLTRLSAERLRLEAKLRSLGAVP